MLNWCRNNISVSQSDPEMMKKFSQGVEDGDLLESFFPLPDDAERGSHRGKKWDISEESFELEDSGLSGSGFFKLRGALLSPRIERWRN